MKQLKQQFVDSWHELRKTKVMAVAAMLIAIGVILGFFSVQLTEFIRIGFSGIPHELAYLSMCSSGMRNMYRKHSLFVLLATPRPTGT